MFCLRRRQYFVFLSFYLTCKESQFIQGPIKVSEWLLMDQKSFAGDNFAVLKHFLLDQYIIPRKTLYSIRICDVSRENTNLWFTAEKNRFRKNCLYQVVQKYYALFLRQSCQCDLNSPLNCLILISLFVSLRNKPLKQWKKSSSYQ